MSLVPPARSPFVVPSALVAPGELVGHRLRHDPNEINHLAQPRAVPPTSTPTTPTPLRSVRPVVPGPRAGCERALTWTACCASRIACGWRIAPGGQGSPPRPAREHRPAGSGGPCCWRCRRARARSPPHLHRATRCALRPVLRAPAIAPHLLLQLGPCAPLIGTKGTQRIRRGRRGRRGRCRGGRGGRRRDTPPCWEHRRHTPPCAQRGRPYLSRPVGQDAPPRRPNPNPSNPPNPHNPQNEYGLA